MHLPPNIPLFHGCVLAWRGWECLVFFFLKLASSSLAKIKSFSLDCCSSEEVFRVPEELFSSAPVQKTGSPLQQTPAGRGPLDTPLLSSQLGGSHTYRKDFGLCISESLNLPSLQNNRRSHCPILLMTPLGEGLLKLLFRGDPFQGLLPKFAPNWDIQ